MESVATILGRNLRAQRLRRSLTQEDLSDMVGIHYTFLGHIERGSKLPSLPVLIRLADALKVTPATLLRGVGKSEGGSSRN